MQPADEAEPDSAQIAPGWDFGSWVGFGEHPVGGVLLAGARNEAKLWCKARVSKGTPRKAMKFIPINLPTSVFVEYLLIQHHFYLIPVANQTGDTSQVQSHKKHTQNVK